MQVVHPRCCGLDIHTKTVVAGVLLTSANGHVQREVRTLGTMTADLLALSDWLAAHEVTQIAMESTGVFWRPVFNLLEEETRTLVLVHPQHLKAVPGRKTDVKACSAVNRQGTGNVWSADRKQRQQPGRNPYHMWPAGGQAHT